MKEGPYMQRIEQLLEKEAGIEKGLLMWCTEINGVLPRNRRLTPRSLAFLFNRVICRRFSIQYQSDPIRYTFYPVSS